MDTFFNTLRQTLIASLFIIFGLVATYVPQYWDNTDNIQVAHAGDATSGLQAAAIPFQYLSAIESMYTTIQTTLSAGYNAITSWATNNLWLKELSLDPAAWLIAKASLSQMTDELVSWIGSGFNGSPGFVQDLQGFLTNAADLAVDDYIVNELGGPASYVCEEFQPQVQYAVARQYNLDRVDQFARGCNAESDLTADLDVFLSGAQGSFGEDGWHNWLAVTSNPSTYTAYGSYLAAQSGVDAVVANTKSEELSILEFGDGFLSQTICNTIQGPVSDRQECYISNPGKIIQEALSFNLDSGRQSLVTADEINEMVANLLGNIVSQTFTGATGLLSIGTDGQTLPGYTGFDPSDYVPPEDATTIDEPVPERPNSFTSQEIAQEAEISRALQQQRQYLSDAILYRNRLSSMTYAQYEQSFNPGNTNNNPLNGNTGVSIISAAQYNTQRNSYINQANSIINKITADIATLEAISDEYNQTNTISIRRQQLYSEFQALEPSLYEGSWISTQITLWSSLLI